MCINLSVLVCNYFENEILCFSLFLLKRIKHKKIENAHPDNKQTL